MPKESQQEAPGAEPAEEQKEVTGTDALSGQVALGVSDLSERRPGPRTVDARKKRTARGA